MPATNGSKSTVLTEIIPSTSVSFVTTTIVIGVFMLVVAESLAANGASFTGETVTVNNAIFETAPLLSFTV